MADGQTSLSQAGTSEYFVEYDRFQIVPFIYLNLVMDYVKGGMLGTFSSEDPLERIQASSFKLQEARW